MRPTTPSSVAAGRNAACPCGSGRKFKACCGRLRSRPVPGPPDELLPLIALLNCGRAEPLEAAARDLLDRRPTLGHAWQLLAEALRRQGKDALHAVEHAAQCLPDDAVAQLNAGNALARSGRFAQAEVRFGRALELAPDLAEAHHSLGVLDLELARLDSAVARCRRAIELRPDLAAPPGSLAKALLRLGRPEEALRLGRRALELDPHCADAHNTVGTLLQQAGRLEEAIDHFRRTLSLDPEFAEAHLNLANALRSTGRLEEAAAGCRRALRIQPNFVAAHASLGTILRLQGHGTEAEASCRAALELEPGSTETLGVLAELQADRGRFGEAEELYRHAAAIDPQSAESWAGIVHLRRMTSQDTAWLTAARKLLHGGLEAPREMMLRFALGKYFDDVGSFEEAFDNYRLANELARRLGPPHDRALLSKTVDLLVSSHSPSWFDRMRAAANPSERPVFIVGMLRSGTSLAEQILASHAAVFGAGELSFWGPASAPAVARALSSGAVLDLSATALRELGEAYLALLNRAAAEAPDAARVIDKLPTNFFFIGLIHAAFPQARILHLRRDRLDTCLSIYFQRFEAANTYANDLEDLAHYHREYRRLMRHWTRILPAGTLLEVPYEGLVEDPAGWSRRMVAFLGLAWDPRCLDFHRNERAVVTASRWQVRQTISTASVGRWRHYERFLGPLRS